MGAALSPPLGEEFYRRDADEVARDLLGALLVRHGRTLQIGRIVETEAYMGERDQASHARFGRTGRTEVMYGPPGRSYIYLIYGMYHMLNAVCAGEGDPQAVLIRAIYPLAGIEAKVDGPGKLARTLGLDRTMSSAPLWRPPLSVHSGERCDSVEVTPRIGIDYAGEWREAPLRFVAAAQTG